jgi:3-hydroxy-9,10-secoandrosta-1,3,5(10)-triene-9,17-dione monooxygenase reductase component
VTISESSPETRSKINHAGWQPREFRDALGNYASGITIIAGLHSGEPVGFTCSSFTSVSIDPPLISFSVMSDSTTYPCIRDTGTFSVSVLGESQDDLASQFARKGTDKWADIAWTPTPNGNPVISESLAWLDCDIFAEHEAGDHYIVLGRVKTLSATAASVSPSPGRQFR